MKSRKTTYVLAVAVLLLWGWIARKIFVPDEPPHSYAKVRAQPEMVKAGDTLSLDYPDPFLGAGGAVRPPVPVRKAGRRMLSKTEKVIPKIKITYVGRVGCHAGELYIVDIEGRRVSLVKGESAGGVTLSAVGKDELVFTCGRNEYRVAVTH